jgi:hypothetical protein
MIDMRMKKLFFSAKAVTSRVDAATRRVLSKFGAFVRRTAKSSIRKRKKASEPGQPPSSHTGLLKKFIWFGYEPNQHSVVIGPARLTSKTGETPEILEHGGFLRLQQDTVLRVGGSGRDAKGRFTQGRRKKVRKGTKLSIAARPYMGPAMDKETPKLPGMWENSIR